MSKKKQTLFKVISKIDGQPTFAKTLSEILGTLELGGGLKVLSPLDYHTDQQRKWVRGVCIRGLSEWNGETESEWDYRLKDECGGAELLKKVTIYLGNGLTCQRLTIVGVGKRNMTKYIENILSRAITMDWPVTPPDKELRKL